MPNLQTIRATKPDSYPDQAVYAEFAASAFGLGFEALDGGSGLAFSVVSQNRQIVFGGGRCSYFPQNSATAMGLAADKYLGAIVLEVAGVATLGGKYFFLGERHRALRPPGHERADAIGYFHALGGAAFVKPLIGSRGDFAVAIYDERALRDHLEAVERHYDSVIMQRIATGDEYRVVVLDDAVLYCARKQPPHIVGDGVAPLRDLLARRNAALIARGVSAATVADDPETVLAPSESRALPGRMNRSAGGGMTLCAPPAGAAELAVKAVRGLGLRVGGVDLFTGLNGDASMRVIEINANPSIRFLEESGRDDLILALWRHTFAAMGLLDV